MYHFDASALIDLWENYPIHRPMFAGVWQWFYEQVSSETFQISAIALKEVKDHIGTNLLGRDIPNSKFLIQALKRIKINNLTPEDLEKEERIKFLLDIKEYRTRSSGVGANDVLIIAIASRKKATLIANEARQDTLPQNKRKFKIPAVCRLESIGIACISLKELLHLDI